MRSVHLVAALVVAGLGLSCAAHLLSVDDSPSRSAAAPVDTHIGFYDGGFETTGDISRDLAALDARQPTGASDLDALTSLLASQAGRPIGRSTTGDVTLVDHDDDTLLEFAAAGETPAELRELVFFEGRNVAIGADLEVLQSAPGALFQIVLVDDEARASSDNPARHPWFSETVLASYELSALQASNRLSTTGLHNYLRSRSGGSSPVAWAHVAFRLTAPAGDEARVRLDNLSVIMLEDLPTVTGFGLPIPDPVSSLQEIVIGPDDPESRREQFQVFMSDIALLFDQIVAQLGPPQPERESDYEFDENADPRLERVSRGVFEDMKAFFGERDAQDADVDYQTKRLDGMSNRIDQQFQDVSSLLREFEEKQYPKRETELEEYSRRMREKRAP
jgi:hypothetical protein